MVAIKHFSLSKKLDADGRLTYIFVTQQDTKLLKRHRRDVFYHQLESLFQDLCFVEK
ncbi:hypothetical protein L798_08712 [Zootermopsis nevadensis]|uniref:Uncharacterized protein n=1 Tax=Zootermopsis nevadensis TaxID=136037 RepID=A0A067RI18_ZOONE|nr:hypothetical protein L798_08712 [Zootermopsis nevadensis]